LEAVPGRLTGKEAIPGWKDSSLWQLPGQETLRVEETSSGTEDLIGSNSLTIRSPEGSNLTKEILGKTRIPWKETLGRGANFDRGIPGPP
jgi:hypothetical protein